jgi:hypothetical protein
MRAILLGLVLLAPLASAFDPGHGVTAGPCSASQTTGVDNWFTTVRCVGPAGEVVYYRAGSGFAGPMCELRVLGDGYACLP